jgi:hypothetical protein
VHDGSGLSGSRACIPRKSGTSMVGSVSSGHRA